MYTNNNKSRYAISAWPTIVLLALGVCVVVFLGMYDSTPRRMVAYVYHPQSDGLYALVETVGMVEPGRWSYLLPYKSPLFGDFESVRYLGRLGELTPGAGRVEVPVAAIAANPRLYDAGVVDAYVISDPRYRARADLDPRDLLPRQWAALAAHLTDGAQPLLAADVALMTRRGDKLSQFEMLHGVLFVRGPAAQQLWRLGYR